MSLFLCEMTSLLFARRIAAPQLREYAESFAMKLVWVQIYTTFYCAEHISDSITDVYFMQLGPFPDLVTYLKQRKITLHLINTEQMTRLQPCDEPTQTDEVPFPFYDYVFRYLEGPNPICTSITDYSFENLKLIRDKVSVCVDKKLHCFVPKEQPQTNARYGVVFVGDAGSDYRRSVLEQIPNARILTSEFGPRRDAILQTHKILLNIHYGETYSIFEELRCLPCILSKIIVVSEESKIDFRHPICKFVLFVKRDMLVVKVNHVLDNYDHYFEQIYLKQQSLFDNLRADIAMYQSQIA